MAFGARWATAPLRTLPDFLIIGAPKSSTTSLYTYLTQHPDVYAAIRKEIWFFDRNYDHGEHWYRGHFVTQHTCARHERHTGRRAITGEASPSYLTSPDAPARAASLLPDARYVVLLRNPVDRAISHYHMLARVGREAAPIEDALHESSGYIRLGMYAEHLERWFAAVPRERLLVLPSAGLTAGPDPGFDRVLSFLGLAPWRPSSFAVHLSGEYPTPDAALRARLTQLFAEPNERLWELLGCRWDWDAAVTNP
jgi:hypothetical protein